MENKYWGVKLQVLFIGLVLLTPGDAGCHSRQRPYRVFRVLSTLHGCVSVFCAPTSQPTTATNESLWLVGGFFLTFASTTSSPTATNESRRLVGGFSTRHAHSPPTTVLMTRFFFSGLLTVHATHYHHKRVSMTSPTPERGPAKLPTTITTNESGRLVGVLCTHYAAYHRLQRVFITRWCFFFGLCTNHQSPSAPTATNESRRLVGGLSIRHAAHSPPPMRVLMTRWFFPRPRYTCLEGRRRARHVGIDNIIRKFWSYVHTFGCHIMQTNILLRKISHETEESGFTMEWKSQTQTSHHVLNTLGLFTVNWIDVEEEMLELQFIPGCKIEITMLNQSWNNSSY